MKISSDFPNSYYQQISYPLARFPQRDNNKLENNNPYSDTENENYTIVNYKVSSKEIFLYQKNENNSGKPLRKYIFYNIYKLVCKVPVICIFIKTYNVRKEKPNKIKPHLENEHMIS